MNKEQEKINWKNLLRKYIQYIKDVEGADYISFPDERIMSDIKFTDEEWSILNEISENRTNSKQEGLRDKVKESMDERYRKILSNQREEYKKKNGTR